MNKRSSLSGAVFFPRTFIPVYLLCAALFFIGVVAGSLLSAGFVDSGAAEEVVSGYLPSMADVAAVGVFRYFLGLLKFPAIAFLLGFSTLGLVGIPVLCFLRGFSLAFTLSVFVRLYAGNGALMGLLLFGAVSALAVPAFLLVACGAFASSARLGRNWLSLPAPPDPDNGAGAYFLRFFAAMLFLFLLAIGERAAISAGLLSLPIFF